MVNSTVIKDIYRNIVNNNKSDYYYIIEDSAWSIAQDGKDITRSVFNNFGIKGTTSVTAYGLRNTLIHYGSLNTLFIRGSIYIPHNAKPIVTIFHIAPDDDRVQQVARRQKELLTIHTSCSLTKDALIKKGFRESKIKIIPLGIDLGLFTKPSPQERRQIKKQLGVPEGKVVIGSFQKDGEGWGDGDIPKMIKGPDIFCTAVTELSKHHKIHVLLTGPARGYVKKCLSKSGIQFTHSYLSQISDVAKYYKALDLYLVTSKVEGGPKSILESMASGVPFVSTNVGMVPDIINDGKNGMVVEIDDVRGIINKANIILSSKAINSSLASQALSDVRKLDIDIIGEKYYKELYLPYLPTHAI